MMNNEFKSVANKTPTLRNWGVDLVGIVASDHLTEGHPWITDQDREMVISLLEKALFDQETNKSLHSDIKHLCGGKFRNFEPLDEAWLERVLAGGLTVLDNQEIAILLLDPDTFCWLKDELSDAIEKYPVWWEPLNQVGGQLMAQHEKTVPELQLDELDGPSC